MVAEAAVGPERSALPLKARIYVAEEQADGLEKSSSALEQSPVASEKRGNTLPTRATSR